MQLWASVVCVLLDLLEKEREKKRKYCFFVVLRGLDTDIGGSRNVGKYNIFFSLFVLLVHRFSLVLLAIHIEQHLTHCSGSSGVPGMHDSSFRRRLLPVFFAINHRQQI
jgi:hypothetical protein